MRTFANPVLEGHYLATMAPTRTETTERHEVDSDRVQIPGDLGDPEIDMTPITVAGIALGALGVLVALKALKFRFVIGVGGGGR